MSFSDLRDHQVTVLQLAEMEEEGSLERFARGWYWCKECGYEKPKDYQYIEIAKVNPRAVICMDSAAWLAGMLEKEPETIAVATSRTDRKKMELENFEIRRFYFQNAGLPGEICEKETEFGSYRYYAPKRTFCDCLRMNNKMPEEVKEEILTWCRKQNYPKEEILAYANKLRAVKNIEEEEKGYETAKRLPPENHQMDSGGSFCFFAQIQLMTDRKKRKRARRAADHNNVQHSGRDNRARPDTNRSLKRKLLRRCGRSAGNGIAGILC